MNTRLKELRINILKLSQVEFAKKIKITQAGLSKLELGHAVLTERTIAMICNTFNINEDWLRNGIEPVILQKETDLLDEFFNKNDVSTLARIVIKKYLNLDKEKRELFETFLLECFSEQEENNK